MPNTCEGPILSLSLREIVRGRLEILTEGRSHPFFRALLFEMFGDSPVPRSEISQAEKDIRDRLRKGLKSSPVTSLTSAPVDAALEELKRKPPH
jgi:hypothetical protein